MLLALFAALAMVAVDITGVIMVMAEARNRGWLAGIMDSFQWLVGITTTTITVTALQSHRFDRELMVLVFVTVANLLGTKVGQMIGTRWVRDKSIEQRLAALEAHVNR